MQIFVPVYSFTEARVKLDLKDGVRRKLAREVQNELNELGRSLAHRPALTSYTNFNTLFIQSSSIDKVGLTNTEARLFQSVQMIPPDRSVLELASRYHDELTSQDALINASVVRHLMIANAETSCFVTTDKKGFDNVNLKAELDMLRCKSFFKFEDALGYLQTQA